MKKSKHDTRKVSNTCLKTRCKVNSENKNGWENRESDLFIVYKISYMFVYLQKCHICFIFNSNLIILFDFCKTIY